MPTDTILCALFQQLHSSSQLSHHLSFVSARNGSWCLDEVWRSGQVLDGFRSPSLFFSFHSGGLIIFGFSHDSIYCVRYIILALALALRRKPIHLTLFSLPLPDRTYSVDRLDRMHSTLTRTPQSQPSIPGHAIGSGPSILFPVFSLA